MMTVDWPAELETMRYFWEQKEDLERMSGWDALQPELRARYPEIVAAWESYKTSRRMLTAVLRGVSV